MSSLIRIPSQSPNLGWACLNHTIGLIANQWAILSTVNTSSPVQDDVLPVPPLGSLSSDSLSTSLATMNLMSLSAPPTSMSLSVPTGSMNCMSVSRNGWFYGSSTVGRVISTSAINICSTSLYLCVNLTLILCL